MYYLKIKGTPAFPRYVIACNNSCWDGEKWIPGDDGFLYADAGEAARKVQDFQREAFADSKHTDFYTIPLHIEVHSDTQLTPDDIASWLKKVIHIECSYGTHGNGPTEDSMVLVAANFNEVHHENGRTN